jgi:hypothetical protein
VPQVVGKPSRLSGRMQVSAAGSSSLLDEVPFPMGSELDDETGGSTLLSALSFEFDEISDIDCEPRSVRELELL